MNRRQFLGQTAKVVAGLVAASVVPVTSNAILTSAAGMIPVAESSPVYEWTGETWKEVSLQVHDLTGMTTISLDLMEDGTILEQQLKALFRQ